MEGWRVTEDRVMRALRLGDHQREFWFWVDGVRKPYICETVDEFLHFCARAVEFDCKVRLERVPKVA